MPKIRSALFRKWWSCLLIERPPEPSDSGCVSGKRALALQARGHRCLQQLGQLAQLLPRARVVHALAGVDHQPVGGHERGRQLGHRLRVGRHAQPRRRRVDEVVGHLRAHDVDGDLHQHRARPAVLHLGEGAPHGVRHRLRQDDLLAPLGDVLEVEQRGEVRGDVQDLSRITAGQHHDRHRVAEGLGHAAERVLGAGAVLHREHADALPRRDAAHGVGHVQADPLLADDDRADVFLGGGLDDLIDRIADEELDAFLLEDLRDGVGGFHGWALLLRPAGPGARQVITAVGHHDDGPRQRRRRGTMDALRAPGRTRRR